MALDPSPEWLEDFDRVTLAACPPLSQEPALAAVVVRSNRGNLVHFATAMLRDPGAPVPANISPETLCMARHLVRRGLDTSALEVYRIGHNLAWRRWTEIAFQLTSVPEELQELLDIPFRLANDFVDSTLAGIAEQMRSEYAELVRDVHAERRKVVELILAGEPVRDDDAQAQLEYTLDQTHCAVIIWRAEVSDDDPNSLDEVAEAFTQVVGSQRTLNITPGAATRWLWIKDAEIKGLDLDLIHDILDAAPGARIAIGTAAPGIEGFRRSHTEALSAQRMMARLRSHQRIAFFADVQLIALLTENSDGADDFIKTTLGDFANASPTLHTTVLTYINAECNASRAAKILYTHRNTLLHRLESAQRLLPRPLNQTTVQVAVAIEALRWRGEQANHSTAKAETNGHRAAASRS